MSGRRGRLTSLAVAVILSSAVLPGAPAQTTPPGGPAMFTPPRAKTPDRPPMLGNIAVAILILSAVVGAALIPSKRGHQD